jgi:hypothetical protein
MDELENASLAAYYVSKSLAHSIDIKESIAYLKYKVRCAGGGKHMAPCMKQLQDSMRMDSATPKPQRRLGRKTSLDEDDAAPAAQPPHATAAQSNVSPFAKALQRVGGVGVFAKGQKINPQEQDEVSIPETIFVPESPEPPPTAAQTRAVRREQHAVIQYWDAGCQAMSRLHKGQTVVAEMLPGGDGFQIAVWPDGTRTSTEQANQLVAPVCKKPAGPAPLKRPAAAIRADYCPESAAGVSAPGFPIYFYKNPPPGAWGLRSSSGAKNKSSKWWRASMR